MSIGYSRLLNEAIFVEHFLENALDYYINDQNLISSIVKGEKVLGDDNISFPTISSSTFRALNYKTNLDRWCLRKKIVHELMHKIRINDDDISLGKGGALPKVEIKNNKQAIIVIGLPASGKSTISNKFAEKYGAIILDSDYAKRKLPEYKNYIVGATLVHEESDSIIFGFDDTDIPSDFKSLFQICSDSGTNIIIPKIGHNHNSIAKLTGILKNNFDYQVHLVLVALDRRKSTIRAIERFKKSKRYVPLGLIFDAYSNEPTLSYYRLKKKFPQIFTSFGKISTDVPRGKMPILIDTTIGSPVEYFNTSNK